MCVGGYTIGSARRKALGAAECDVRIIAAEKEEEMERRGGRRRVAALVSGFVCVVCVEAEVDEVEGVARIGHVKLCRSSITMLWMRREDDLCAVESSRVLGRVRRVERREEKVCGRRM